MFDTHKPHPLLAQVPLTVSPFLSIPTAVTLPYTYRATPASLPPSIVDDGSSGKTKYITSASGHSAHPEDLLRSYQALNEHMTKQLETAKSQIEEWEQGIRDRELAEKRRIAPGWLDRDSKVLEPTKTASTKNAASLLDEPSSETKMSAVSHSREAEELDRAFGTLGVK